MRGDALVEAATPWTMFLAQLDDWTSQHGHANVPQAATGSMVHGRPYALGLRVARYRAMHRRGELAAERTADLEQRPGWAWDAASALWDGQVAQLAEHARIHGTLQGISRALQAWLLRQRADLTRLPPHRRQQLARIPGALDDRRNRVNDFVRAARTWLKRHPGKSIDEVPYASVITINGQRYPLGRRITYYRRRHAGLEPNSPAMKPADVHAIETLPGWTWPLKHRAQGRSWRSPDDHGHPPDPGTDRRGATGRLTDDGTDGKP